VEFFGQTLSAGSAVFLLLALLLALTFEFVNGFHDTANAVATVIYTHTWKPAVAVVWSGCWNLIGVLASSGAVAFGVVALLPTEVVLDIGSMAGFATVFALLLSAIIWNLGTWYFGLPASSSHTLVGAILGVGLGNSMFSGATFSEGVNWTKAGEVGLSLLISPLVGFVCAALLLLVSKAILKKPELYRAPTTGQPPPLWIRGLLILTCTGVSYAHGSNDGQKGMGLIMLILIGILPVSFAINLNTPPETIARIAAESRTISGEFARYAPVTDGIPAPKFASDELSRFLKAGNQSTESTYAALDLKCQNISDKFANKTRLDELTPDNRRALRSDLYLTSEALAKLIRLKQLPPSIKEQDARKLQVQFDSVTKFIPAWIKVAVAIALGLGTMVGWKRIVVTVGERIGKEHLTYAQGAAAELVAMTTILAADQLGLPVSTTHVLSSGVAGTMLANRSGLQMGTMRNLLLAWVLTLPVCVLMGAGIFAFGLNLLLRFGARW
jgi:PiT family inorganic phosphate transporter